MRKLFDLDGGYVRPLPERWWVADLTVAAILSALTALGLWTVDENAQIGISVQLGGSLLAVAAAGVLIAFRRRHPLLVLVLCTGVHFIVVGNLLPFTAAYAPMQLIYFLGLYSAMAWASRRDVLLWAVCGVVAAMVIWVILDFVVSIPALAQKQGYLAAALTLVLSVALNLAYFGAAIWLGGKAWLQARDYAELQSSRAVIEEQGRQLTGQAVLDERLRIARDLHDSVAHHVALIGVQAAAARRAMDKKPDAAAEALLEIESSARTTVEELRTMLGSLRSADDAPAGRGLDALPELLEENRRLGLSVDYSFVGPDGGLDEVPVTSSRALYRVVQESLTNIRKHSTATSAKAILRLTGESAEAEIIDSGLPKAGADGTGFGQRGIRERVTLLGGTAEMGRRPGRGYRVLARLPLTPGGTGMTRSPSGDGMSMAADGTP